MSKILRQNVGGVDYTMVGCALTGTCSSAAGAFIKVVTLSDGDEILDGMSVAITFANGNTAGNAPSTQTIYSSDQINYYADAQLTEPITLAPAGCYSLEYTGAGYAYTYQSFPVVQIGNISAPIYLDDGTIAGAGIWANNEQVILIYIANKFRLLRGTAVDVIQAGNMKPVTSNAVSVAVDEIVGRHSTDITALLQAGGYIRLASGSYSISQPVVLPQNTVIEGKGYNTEINCSSIANNYAITMTSNCEIRNLLFNGNGGNTIPATDGGQGCIKIGQTDTPADDVTLENIYIHGFTGYGILGLRSSGYTIYRDPIRITNVQVCYCYVGIAFGVPCQYAQISNCTFAHNNYGCANQDGNNIFVNCQFNGNVIGYYMNGAESPNWNAHGAVTGCQFNHNTQYSIWLNHITAGQIFTGCVAFYGSLKVENSKQVQFVGCELAWLDDDSFIVSACIGTCVFADNIIQRTTPNITIDYANVVGINNRLSNGTELFSGLKSVFETAVIQATLPAQANVGGRVSLPTGWTAAKTVITGVIIHRNDNQVLYGLGTDMVTLYTMVSSNEIEMVVNTSGEPYVAEQAIEILLSRIP